MAPKKKIPKYQQDMAQSVDALSGKFDEPSKQFEGFQTMMKETLDALSGVGAWQASADKAFDELRQRSETTVTSLGAVNQRVERAAARMDAWEARLLEKSGGGDLVCGPLPPPPPLPPRPPPHWLDLNLAPRMSSHPPAMDRERPKGHDVLGGGILGPRPPLITEGMYALPNPLNPLHSNHDFTSDWSNSRSPPFPKMDFPKFYGEFPRLWRDRCEMFFEVYSVPAMLKTRFAALNFRGAAATWLQTVERKGRIVDWGQLCALVMTKFDKNQYQLLLKQFEALRQKGSVEDYQEEFDGMAHGLLLYNDGYDDTYFVTRFVAGLKEEIRSVIILHQPKDGYC